MSEDRFIEISLSEVRRRCLGFALIGLVAGAVVAGLIAALIAKRPQPPAPADAALAQKCAQLEKTNGELAARVENLVQEGAAAANARTSEVEQATAPLAAKVKQLTADKEDLNQQLGKLEKEKAELEGKLAARPAATPEPDPRLAELQAANQKLTAELAAGAKDRDNLTQKLALAEQQAKAAVDEKALLAPKVEALQKANDESGAQAARMQQENAALKGELETVKGDNKILEGRVKELLKEAMTPPVGNQPSTALQKQVTTLQTENERLREQLRTGAPLGPHAVTITRLDVKGGRVTCLVAARRQERVDPDDWEWVYPLNTDKPEEHGTVARIELAGSQAPRPTAADQAGKALYLVTIEMDETQYWKLAAKADLRKGVWPEDFLDVRLRKR